MTDEIGSDAQLAAMGVEPADITVVADDDDARLAAEDQRVAGMSTDVDEPGEDYPTPDETPPDEPGMPDYDPTPPAAPA